MTLFCLVSQSCPTLCDPMDCSMTGFPIHHQLLELAQTHVHQVDDAIQPSHPLLSPSPPTFNLFHIRVFSNGSVIHIRWAKYWSFSFRVSPATEYSGLISFRMDWLGEGGRRGVQDGEHMYTCGGFMSMYGKTNTIL